MKDFQKKQMENLLGFRDEMFSLFQRLPDLLREAENKGCYEDLRQDLMSRANQRYLNWKNYHDSSCRQVSQQVFENDCLWGEVGELVDYWKTKQTGLSMEWKRDNIKGIDFVTPSGLEDTKWSLRKWNDFPIELKSRGAASHHWKYVAEGKKVFLRFINAEGCWRIELKPEMKKEKGRDFFGQTTIYDCPIKNFKKVWSW